MKRDREDLEIELLRVITDIKKDKKTVLRINNELSKLGVPMGVFENIAKGDEPLATINQSVLCALTESVFLATGSPYFNSLEWFTEGEITNSWEILKEETKDNGRMMLPIPIEDAGEVSMDNYTIPKVKMSFLVEMFHAQLIKYNFETQRSAKYKMGKNGVVPVPDINMKSVKDIAENMLNGTYLPDTITLNVYSDEVEAIKYNPKTRMLTINDGAVISILDGFHRLQGGVRAYAVNPELEQVMTLSVRSYDSDTAKKYFGQINTINVVKKERIRELKSQEFSDLVVKDLQQKSELKGKIASASKISEMADQLTTFDVLSYSIDAVFKPTSRLEAKNISTTLIQFYDYLCGSFVEEFITNIKSHRPNNMNHALSFVGFTVIAKHFEENKINLKDIKSFVSKIDFNSDELSNMLRDKRGINSPKVRNNLIKYFANVVEGIKNV